MLQSHSLSMQYDLVVVVDPKQEEKEATQKINTILEKEGFSVSVASSLGKKHLAYPLKKRTEELRLANSARYSWE